MTDSRRWKPSGTIVAVVMPILTAAVATLLTHHLLGQFQAAGVRTSITADLGSLLTNLQPNLHVVIVAERLAASGNLDLALTLANKGASTLRVSGHSLDLSYTPIDADSRRGNLLTQGKDYEVVGNIATAGYTPPGAVLKQAINVRLKTPMPSTELHYVVTYTAETEPALRAIMRQSLGESVAAFGPQLDSLAKATFFIASTVRSQSR